MGYANLGDVRKLAGGTSTNTLSDSDMQDFLDYGDAAIESCTGLTDVQPSDPRYNLMTQGAEYYASSAVRDHLSDREKKADTHLARAKEICLLVINFNLSGNNASSITSMSQGYQTYPLNPEGTKFRDRYISVNDTENIFL